MIFLVEYDRKEGKILDLKSFRGADRAFAQRERLSIELENHRSGLSREVVLLEAADEKILRRTHQRYFKSPGELVESLKHLEAVG